MTLLIEGRESLGSVCGLIFTVGLYDFTHRGGGRVWAVCVGLYLQ